MLLPIRARAALSLSGTSHRIRELLLLLAVTVGAALPSQAQETPPLDAPSGTRSPAKNATGAAKDGASPNDTGSAAAAQGDEALARSIVERADAVRFPNESFQVEVTVKSRNGDEELEPRVYRVSSKGNENTIVQTLAPPSERGQNMLMRGRELWIFMPSVSQPVRLSLSQRLTGQVANGDLARANFSGDYDPTLVGTEQIDGREYYVLELVAAQRGVTYPKVKYWVQKSNMHPYRAEFHAASGRLLKTASYEDFRKLGDRIRPTKLVLTDALKPADVSVMEYENLRRVELPDRFFTKDYMKKLD
ncbi:MAG: outer membrane lipoprotein-sorting protein [Burkholderiaceae bacterium]|nr:outer membrane lipoprotein-sorting protein [Burkholderiaceae bacterium]